jgi:phospho-N-acetylmuramoyl-pentapeptide-transferase
VLYHLLTNFPESTAVANLFRYQTFRAMLAFLLAFGATLAALPPFISWLRRKKIGDQPIRDDGPQSHLQTKSGTPTMGGLVMVAAVAGCGLLLCDLSEWSVWVSLFVLLGYGALGFLDDWRKVSQQNSKGLSERQKLVWQCGIAVAAVAALVVFGGTVSSVEIPFLKDMSLALGLFFIPFAAVVLVGTSNAVNLTDGLDGLAIGSIMTVAATYALFAYLGGNKIASDYLGLVHVPGAGELSVILAAVIGAGLGFLWFNAHPAQVFMGDTGALALGALLGVIAVITKHELILIVCGGVFVVEALSVIIQRRVYKATKKRFFRMAPLHHHFELLGWAENKIIVRFWIISIVLALLSLTTLKIR